MNKTHKIGQHLIAETIQRSRGQDVPYCVGDEPNDKYFIANLSPEYGSPDREEFDAKTRPSDISIDCQPEAGSTAHVRVSFDFYVPSLPTYEEYLEIQDRRLRAGRIDAVDKSDGGESPDDIDVSEIDRDILYTFDEAFYRRGSVSVTGDVDVDAPAEDAEALSSELKTALREEVAPIGEAHPLTEDSVSVDELSTADLADLSESKFEAIRARAATLAPERLDWDVRFTASTADGELTLSLSNHPTGSADADPNEGPGEQYIFNPKLSVQAPLEPYTFDLIPKDYRYDQQMWSKGRNCSTTVDHDTTPMTVETTSVPTAPVYEFDFNTDYDTDFAELSRGETIQTLRDIAAGMRAYHDVWMGERRAEVADELDLAPAELDEFDADAESFETEIQRFEHGIDVLESDPDALRAFRLMNEVNARQHDFPGWRLFQLVFIASNLSSIVRRERPDLETEYDDLADVLWFPTGGGKTEAYLGLIIFNLFYDPYFQAKCESGDSICTSLLIGTGCRRT